MLKHWLKKQEGFTLIEVVLVLAIAGLIMVIIFLALTGAQRSRRDTERKSAAGRLIAAADQVASNSNGVYAANCAGLGTAYNAGGYACSNVAPTNATIQYVPNAACNAAGNGTVPATRSAAALALLETGGVTYCAGSQ